MIDMHEPAGWFGVILYIGCAGVLLYTVILSILG